MIIKLWWFLGFGKGKMLSQPKYSEIRHNQKVMMMCEGIGEKWKSQYLKIIQKQWEQSNYNRKLLEAWEQGWEGKTRSK